MSTPNEVSDSPMDIQIKDEPMDIQMTEENDRAEMRTSGDDEQLNLGLDDDAKHQFWEETWPSLIEEGWIKKTIPEDATDASNDSPARPILASRGDLDIESSEEGLDYFFTVADVIEFLNKKEEPQVEERSRRTVMKPEHFDPTYSPSFRRQRRKKISTPPKESPQVDMTWKEGRNHFPKRTSSIGENFQATDIPKAGSYLEDNAAGTSYKPELVWDPAKAKEAGVQLDEADPIAQCHYNLREAALFELARSGYNADTLKTATLKPTDGSDWTQEQKDTFHSAMFRLRRDLPAVAKLMKVPIKVCHTYYLNTYKQTCDYRLLKTVCIDEHETKLDNDEHEQDACVICGDGGNLLICDGCEGEFHLTCLQPRLKSIPEGHWECDECVDRRFLEARDYLLSHSKMFETIEKKKRGADGEMKVTYEFKPIPQALEAARRFVNCLNEILAVKETQS